MTSHVSMKASPNNLLVVFDTGGCSPVSMQTVIQLAGSLKIEVNVLYIEDSKLLDVVELPFTREVSIYSAELVPVNAQSILKKLRSEANSLRQLIERMAGSHRISYSFKSVRGEKVNIARNQSGEESMVLIPAAFFSPERKSTHHLNQLVAVVYEHECHACEDALNVALRYAEINRYQLFVLITSHDSLEHVQEVITTHDVNAVYQIVNIEHINDVLILLKKHPPSLLVVPWSSLLASDESLKYIQSTLESDLLLLK